MRLRRSSPCKVNLLLNILGRRADGFHELESLMVPVPLTDGLEFERSAGGVTLECDHPELPVDGGNLVHRAASRFLAEAGIGEGVRIRLEKRLPLAAGLGGGSANAAVTLRALNELFSGPLAADRLQALAAELGSDVPFFLRDGPALATGRGERIEPLAPFEVLRGRALVLVHPGFGVPTAWAYRQLAQFPDALNGRVGRARELAASLRAGDLNQAASGLFNSLEAPVLPKHPILSIFREFFLESGASAALMSGSGSTTFALVRNPELAREIEAAFRGRFGATMWTATVEL